MDHGERRCRLAAGRTRRARGLRPDRPRRRPHSAPDRAPAPRHAEEHACGAAPGRRRARSTRPAGSPVAAARLRPGSPLPARAGQAGRDRTPGRSALAGGHRRGSRAAPHRTGSPRRAPATAGVTGGRSRHCRGPVREGSRQHPLAPGPRSPGRQDRDRGTAQPRARHPPVGARRTRSRCRPVGPHRQLPGSGQPARRGRRRWQRRCPPRARRRPGRPGGADQVNRRHPHRLKPARRSYPGRSGDPVRAVIADDSVLMREGITRILAEGQVEVVAGVGDAPSLLEAVENCKPELAIIDVRMPPTYIDEGLRAAIEIRHRWPAVALVVLSQFVEERYASELLADNTDKIGYLLKDRISDAGEFIEALQRVANGGTALDPQVVRQLLARSRKADPLRRLTSREAEVLALMAEGRSNTAIAEAFVVSARAVEKHIASIFMKLELPPGTEQYHRRVMAVVRYLNS